MTRTLFRATLAAAAVVASVLVPFSQAGTESVAASERLIVVLKPGSDPRAVADQHARSFGAQILYVYEHALQGYAAAFPAGQAGALADEPQVAYVERDGTMSASTTQTKATWGLDRIDQRSLPLSKTYTYNATGAGVTAYVIDTGIRITHKDFQGRAVSGHDSVDGGQADDCHGHGTHVAGTIGGKKWGVAKSVQLVAVRVLNCSGFGSTSGVIAGVDWVTGDHGAGETAVANMSLGGSPSNALDNAVNNSISDGVGYAIAAGNGDQFGVQQDACTVSPARVPAAMTISATNSSDQKASWANYGNCVDWFAPGVSITSAWATSNRAKNTISGTSMAAPHTAGVAALYLQGNPGASPANVRTALFNLTTKDIVTLSSTANNDLLFTNF